MTAVVAPKNWLSTFDGHSFLEYDSETDSSTPKTHHILVERNYLRNVYSNIFTLLKFGYTRYIFYVATGYTSVPIFQ